MKEESLAYGIVFSKINPNNTKNEEKKLIFNSLGNGHRPNHRNLEKLINTRKFGPNKGIIAIADHRPPETHRTQSKLGI